MRSNHDRHVPGAGAPGTRWPASPRTPNSSTVTAVVLAVLLGAGMTWLGTVSSVGSAALGGALAAIVLGHQIRRAQTRPHR